MINSRLMDYYQTTFQIMTNPGWNPEYIDNLIPFERDLYFGFLLNKRKAEAELDRLPIR